MTLRIINQKILRTIFFLIYLTSTNTTVIKEKQESEDNANKLEVIFKDKYRSADGNNILTFGTFNYQAKNESNVNNANYSQANKENESDTNSTTISSEGKHSFELDGERGFKTNDIQSKNNTYLSIDGNTTTKKVGRQINYFKTREKINKTRIEIKVEPRDISDAIDFGIKSLEELVKVREPQLYNLGLFLNQDHPAARAANFGAPKNSKAILFSQIGFASLEASKKIAESYPENVGRQSAGIPEELQSKFESDVCPLRVRPRCPRASKRFRTSDGTCNNLEHPWRGSAMLPTQRFLPPVYEDGIQSLRRSVFGGPLPSPRQLSTVIHKDRNVEIQSVTLMFMQWGQFIDHDVTSTVKSISFNGSIPMCCGEGGRSMLPPELLHPSCLPIDVASTDPFLSRFNIRCMEFIRSAPSTRIDCELGWREQINQVTSYIDASMIYGSDVDTSDSIRTFRNGQIFYGRAHSQGPLNPPDPPEGDLCRAGALSDECIQAGDGRVSENPALVAMHTVFVRYHNKVAAVLSKINPHWSDERIFQETRRIVYSAIQHITYREYLPILLGPEVMDLFELRLLKNGYYNKYDDKVNPSIAGSFSTAAFRFGHSMVQNSFIRSDSLHVPLLNNVSLHEEPSNFENIWSFGSVDRILLGLSNQPSQKRDKFIAKELTNHLFQFSDATPFGMDLAAINIQRGRDHGIPPFTFWREPCRLSPITKWSDLEKILSISTVIGLKSLYQHVDDVDLYTAGLAEKPLKGGVVGPTFACIIAQQFSNLRKGDRFWYENDGFESSLSPIQLQQIRKVSLAQIICQTMDEVETIQPFVFLSADNLLNARVSCDSPEIRNFDLAAWTEKSFEFNSISENLDPFEQERSQKENPDLMRQKREIDIDNLKKNSVSRTNLRPVTIKPKYLSRIRRNAHSTKKKAKTTTSRPKHVSVRFQTKTNTSTRKHSTTRPLNSETASAEVKYGISNTPENYKITGYSTTKRSKHKPHYYQIQDRDHNDVTYLFGILPERTTKAPLQVTPLQVNININYSPHPIAATATLSPTKKKKRPYITTNSDSLIDVTSRPVLIGTHRPLDSYGQSNVILVTKRPATPTQKPATVHSVINYPVSIDLSAYDRPTSYQVTTKKPTYYFDNYDFLTTNHKKPNNNAATDTFLRPISGGYYHENNNKYTKIPVVFNRPIGPKPSTVYETSGNYDNDDFTDLDRKPTYISNSYRPSVFEGKPFSSSNRPINTQFSGYGTDKYSNNRPLSNYNFDSYYDTDTLITDNKRRPQTNAYNKDEHHSTDDILDEFFKQKSYKSDNTNRISTNTTISNTKPKITLNINDHLDFKSRSVNKKTDIGDSDEDRFLKIGSVKKEEFIGREADDIIKEDKTFYNQVRSARNIRAAKVDEMPNESRDQWKYFNATEEPTFYMEMPELPVNMPCSYEVPKPMTNFLPSITSND